MLWTEQTVSFYNSVFCRAYVYLKRNGDQTAGTLYSGLDLSQLPQLNLYQFHQMLRSSPSLFEFRGSLLVPGSSASAAGELLLAAHNVEVSSSTREAEYSLTDSCQVGTHNSFTNS